MTSGFASSRVILIRSGGLEGSIGRYPAPALRAASIETIISSDRSKQIATNESGFAPCLNKMRASWLERRSSSRYVMRSQPNWIAMRSGVRSACCSKHRSNVRLGKESPACGFHCAINSVSRSVGEAGPNKPGSCENAEAMTIFRTPYTTLAPGHVAFLPEETPKLECERLEAHLPKM